MASRSDYRTEAVGSNYFESTRSLFRMSGWGNVNGPGFFMIRLILSASSAAAVMGFGGAMVTAAVWGTAGPPFIVSACLGFVFGAVGFYRDAARQSLAYLDRYPRLLQLHLDANFPTRGFLQYRRDQLRAAVFSREWKLQSMLICSWLTAQPALEVRYGFNSCRLLWTPC